MRRLARGLAAAGLAAFLVTSAVPGRIVLCMAPGGHTHLILLLSDPAGPGDGSQGPGSAVLSRDHHCGPCTDLPIARGRAAASRRGKLRTGDAPAAPAARPGGPDAALSCARTSPHAPLSARSAPADRRLVELRASVLLL